MSEKIDPRRPVIDLELEKFRHATGDPTDVGVKVFGDLQASAGTHPLESVDWDSYSITRNTLTDVVEYYQGGLAGTLLITFTATFETSRKKNLVSGVWETP